MFDFSLDCVDLKFSIINVFVFLSSELLNIFDTKEISCIFCFAKASQFLISGSILCSLSKSTGECNKEQLALIHKFSPNKFLR